MKALILTSKGRFQCGRREKKTYYYLKGKGNSQQKKARKKIRGKGGGRGSNKRVKKKISLYFGEEHSLYALHARETVHGSPRRKSGLFKKGGRSQSGENFLFNFSGKISI